MFIHFDGSASFSGRGTAARRQLGSANWANPCMHCRRNPSPSGSGICANGPTPFCLQNTGPSSGTKEFPVAAAHTGALLFRMAGMEGRSGDRRSTKPVAGIAEIGISPKRCAPRSNRRRGSRNCGNPAAAQRLDSPEGKGDGILLAAHARVPLPVARGRHCALSSICRHCQHVELSFCAIWCAETPGLKNKTNA